MSQLIQVAGRLDAQRCNLLLRIIYSIAIITVMSISSHVIALLLNLLCGN